MTRPVCKVRTELCNLEICGRWIRVSGEEREGGLPVVMLCEIPLQVRDLWPSEVAEPGLVFLSREMS